MCETEWDLLNLLEDGAPAAGFLLGDSVAASSPGVTDWHGRPTAAELVGAVAEFLDGAVRDATSGQVQFHARVAANALRMVARELTATDVDRVTAALGRLGAADEATLAAAIRRGDLDGRTDEVLPMLRALVRHRLAAAHPGYEDDR